MNYAAPLFIFAAAVALAFVLGMVAGQANAPCVVTKAEADAIYTKVDTFAANLTARVLDHAR